MTSAKPYSISVAVRWRNQMPPPMDRMVADAFWAGSGVYAASTAIGWSTVAAPSGRAGW
ncbi:hypothetical protein AB0K48_21345 [Nonomuraea sp. NPDC055795]